MSLLSHLHSAPAWSVDAVRDYIRRHHPDDYYLIDVRQSKEYAAGHLPGARLMPMEELKARLAELAVDKMVIVYSGSGLRSRSALHLLVHAGFREVRSMRGGIDAWQGKMAKGLPKEDVVFFTAAGSPREQIILAWRLEEGTRCFYTNMAESVMDLESVSLFRELAIAEEHHKATLQALYEGIAGAPTLDFQEWVAKPDEQWMEGGMRLRDAVAWTRGRQINDILEFGIALETNAYDRYLRLRQDLPDENSRRVFEVLADEERHHLEKLSRLLDHFI